MTDVIKVVIEQSDDEGLLSRVTGEWHQMPNVEANQFNLATTQAILEVVKGFAAQKAAANPTG
jgi:hypothetical protein